jgi:hypothetical protein
MKQFELQHLFFDDKGPESFSTDTPPKWLVSREYKWFWEKHVLTLEVGGSIKTDFNKITRVG